MSLESFGLTNNILIMWSVLGLISGILAKLILPGKDKGGLITTILTGITGSFLGGVIGNYFNITTVVGGITILSVVTAVVGSIAVLILLRLLKLLI